LTNYEADPDGCGDEGTVWFDENGAEEAILEQLSRVADGGLLIRGEAVGDNKASRFLDLGTGNGHLLFTLREEDEDGQCWQGEMVGVDYSPTSVQLARRIATQREAESVRFEQWNLLGDPPGPWLEQGFDVVLDKGTFDAISLMPHIEDDHNPCDIYREKVVPLVKVGSFLSITSCNWTKDELMTWLAPKDGKLEFFDEAKYPTFTFGGRTGQTIVTLIFRRKI
jgi:EEF1A lysine methyltransferase 2